MSEIFSRFNMFSVYKFVLALLGYRLVWLDRFFILSRNVKTREFVSWYIDTRGLIFKYQTYKTPDEAKFGWLILMKRQEGEFVCR